MPNKNSTLTIRIPEEVKTDFSTACRNHGTTMSKMLYNIILDLIRQDKEEQKELKSIE